MIVAILKVTRYLTGSQCSFWSAVVIVKVLDAHQYFRCII